MTVPISEADRQRLNRLFADVEGHFAAGRLTDAEAACVAMLAALEPLLAAQPEEPGLRHLAASMHYNRGNALCSMGRVPESEPCFRTALAAFESLAGTAPDDAFHQNNLAQARFNLANTLLHLNRPAEAAPLFRSAGEVWERLTAADPATAQYAHDLARSQFNLALCCQRRKQFPEMEAAFLRAREVWTALRRRHGDRPEFLWDLARCHHALGRWHLEFKRWPQAEAALRDAAEVAGLLTQAHPGVRPYRGMLLSILDDTRSAQSAQRRVDELLATHRRTAAVLEELAREEPGNPQHLSRLAQDHVMLANWMVQTGAGRERAEEFYLAAVDAGRRWLAAHPGPEARRWLAVATFDLAIEYRERGLFDAAEETYRRALPLWQRLRQERPDDPLVFNYLAGTPNQLGIVYLDTGRFAKARQEFEKTLALREGRAGEKPDDFDNLTYLGGTLCNLGNLALEEGRLDDARGLYERSLQALEDVERRRGGSPIIRQYLTNAREGRRQVQERARNPAEPLRLAAATAYGRPPGPSPQRTGDALDRADELRSQGAADEALREVDAVLKDHPDNARAWYLRGLILGRFLGEQGGEFESHDAQRSEEAIEAFDRAILLAPDDFEARLFKGRLLQQECHAAQAHFRALSGAVQGRPDAEAHLRPARLWFRCAFQRARESFERAARIRPDDPAPNVDLGRLLTELVSGHEAEAEAAFRRAVALRPDLAEGWYELARLASGRDDRTAAREHLRRALAAEPDLRGRVETDFPWFTEGE